MDLKTEHMSDFDDDEEFGLGEETNKVENDKPAGAILIMVTAIQQLRIQILCIRVHVARSPAQI